MTPEQMRILIAEACGWKRDTRDQIRTGTPWTDPDGLEGVHYPPDYLSDLNAMHEAEKARWTGDLERLHNDPSVYREWCEYKAFLRGNIHSSASDRAKAFVLTLNLEPTP